MPAFLFDLDGVFYEGDRAIAGAAGVTEWARSRSLPYLFITNTTSRDRQSLAAKLSGFGIQAEPEQILTPAVAAVEWLQIHIKGKTALFVPEGIRHEFSGISVADGFPEEAVAAVVIGDMGESWDYSLLNSAFHLLMRQPQPELVALGMTRYWKAADGLRLDVAPFVAALQHASGVEPIIMGKPSPAFYRAALKILCVKEEHVFIVGDDIRSDIGGAQKCGIRGILVKTGKFRPDDLKTNVVPYAVLDSIADLPAWWQHESHFS